MLVAEAISINYKQLEAISENRSYKQLEAISKTYKEKAIGRSYKQSL